MAGFNKQFPIHYGKQVVSNTIVMKTIGVIFSIGILAILIGCANKEINTEAPREPKFNQLQYFDETQSFSFVSIGSEKNVFPLIDTLVQLWGKPSIYPVQLHRNSFAEYFLADEQLPQADSRPRTALTAYDYIFHWEDKRFPSDAGAPNSISLHLSSIVLSSPLWEPLYPEDWDSVFSIRAIRVAKVDIRISQDEVNALSFSEYESVKAYVQPLLNNLIGPPTEFVPPKQHFIDFLALHKRKGEIKKRFPPEMQEGSFPVVGIPRDREEIDLRLAFTYPIAEPITYTIQVMDSLNNKLEYELYASHDVEKQGIDEVLVPASAPSKSSLDTYIYHLRLTQPELVDKIMFKRNGAEEFLIYQKGEQTSAGFLMRETMVMSEEN